MYWPIVWSIEQQSVAAYVSPVCLSICPLISCHPSLHTVRVTIFLSPHVHPTWCQSVCPLNRLHETFHQRQAPEKHWANHEASDIIKSLFFWFISFTVNCRSTCFRFFHRDRVKKQKIFRLSMITCWTSYSAKLCTNVVSLRCGQLATTSNLFVVVSAC